MNAYNLFGPGEIHRTHPLKEPIIVNQQLINEIIIWDHYEDSHSEYMDDKIILDFISRLNNNQYTLNKEKFLNDGRMWRTYYEIFHIEKKAYLLAWYQEEGRNSLWVLNCFRRHRYDKK